MNIPWFACIRIFIDAAIRIRLIDIAMIEYESRVILDIASINVTVSDKSVYVLSTIKLSCLIIHCKAGSTITKDITFCLDLSRHSNVYLETIIVCLDYCNCLREFILLCYKCHVQDWRVLHSTELGTCIEIVLCVLHHTVLYSDNVTMVYSDHCSFSAFLEKNCCICKDRCLRYHVGHLESRWC